MDNRPSFSHIIRRNPATPRKAVLICAVCRFPGVPADQEPAAQWGLPPAVITGTLYVGVRADADVTTFDKEVMVVRPRGTCPACGAERYLDGAKGSGNRTP